MSASMTLQARLDNVAAESLTRDLLEARGTAILIDAERVIYCGTLAMQVLVSACRQWTKDGHRFAVENPSDELMDACRLLGVPTESVGIAEKAGGSE